MKRIAKIKINVSPKINSLKRQKAGFDETRITKTHKMNIENLIVGIKYLLTDHDLNIIEVTYLGIDDLRCGERIKLLKKGESIHSIYYLNDIKLISNCIIKGPFIQSVTSDDTKYFTTDENAICSQCKKPFKEHEQWK